jgi:polyisoprenyl-teichoic acid--peptidoglycan teichoic acid transferase
MQAAHETLPRGRSPFAAAFLSLVFPGLGHGYLGAYRRGVGFAAPVVLLGALAAGFAVRMNVFDLAGLAAQPLFQIGTFIGNLVVLAYRGYAIVDAWSIARALSDKPARSATAAVRQAGVLSIAGLGAVLLVMSGVHVAVARYDILLQATTNCIFNPDADSCSPTESDTPEETPGPTEQATPEPSLGPTVTDVPIPEWDGNERLNILLVGVDEQGGGFNTDTMITVSIDPKTDQVVMFQLPRDTVDVPTPPGPVRNYYGSVYSAKINSFAANANRADFYPGNTKAHTRGLNGLKDILGNLYGLDIKYYVEVNFGGFMRVVNALGGVTVNVQVPVLDDNFPQPNGARLRLYIPAGIQHMTGDQALRYARSRKSTSDFERAARQQRVLVSLREQLDIGQAIQNIDALAAAIGSSVKTDIPVDLVPRLLGLADKISSRSIRSVIFTPPYYQTECLSCGKRGYIIQPNIPRIRAAVRDAFDVDPNLAAARDALLQEGAQVWVLNGSGRTGEAARLAQFLSYLGMDATAPNQRPDTSGLRRTTIRAYNGAETTMPLTLAALEQVFGVQVVPMTDPAVRADFTVITGVTTPQLTPPPVP